MAWGPEVRLCQRLQGLDLCEGIVATFEDTQSCLASPQTPTNSIYTAEVLPSVSKVAGVWRSLFWCLESVMLWRGIMGFTKFGDKRVNDLALLSGYVVGVACLHRENPCRRICMQLAPRTSWSSVLYLSFLFAMLCSSSFGCIFIRTNPKQTLLMSARSSFHWGMSTFLVTPSMCCVFICTNSRHTLKTCLCCAFYWRKPCHDHTFDLLCFHMYKPQSNLNSRQRTKPRVAARKKRN